ncbi:MAG TPA: hypothetical protein VGN07_16185 [Steroidobacteraceae bacterium]|jgi:hypothetical protein
MRMLIALAALASCCASQAQTTETVPPPKPAAPQTSAVTAVAATPATTEAAAAEVKIEKFKVPPGYKAREKDGTTLYCRKEVILGSRFPKEMCLTVAQLKDIEERGANQRMEMARGRNCGGPCTPNGN